MWLLYVSPGEADKTPPSFAQQSILDQGTNMTGIATAAGDDEVPVGLCIIFNSLKATLVADLLKAFFVFSLLQYNYIY